MNFTFAYKPILLLLIPAALWAYLKYKKGNTGFNFSMTHKLVKFTGSFERIIGRVPLILRASRTCAYCARRSEAAALQHVYRHPLVRRGHYALSGCFRHHAGAGFHD